MQMKVTLVAKQRNDDEKQLVQQVSTKCKQLLTEM